MIVNMWNVFVNMAYKLNFNFWKRLSRPWRWALIVVAAVVVIVVAFRLFGNGNQSGEVALVTRGNIVQKVSVSGKVESAQKVELAFETGGTVRQIMKSEGANVEAGDLIASLNTAELAVRLARQQAALEKARLALATLVEPPTVTEKLAAEDEVSQSREALAAAEDDSDQALTEALVNLPTVLETVESLATAGNGYLSDNQIRYAGNRAQEYKERAEAAYWAARRSYDQAKKAPAVDAVYQADKLTAVALKELYALISYLDGENDSADDTELIADKATLSDYTAEINADLAALLAASNSLEQASRDLAEAEEKQRDLLDGADAKEVATKQLDVRQAELDVEDTRVQIAKQQIRAPFAGIVARNDLELGETVVVGDAQVSMISANDYEVVSKVPEAEIFKIEVADPAQITFDAYPPEELRLEARVSAVNPAEVVVDGVATYKVTLALLNQSDKVKSGMTANVEIIGASKPDALVVPERALLTKNGAYFVRVPVGQGAEERSVSVGLRGSDGQVEIISGLAEGERVLIGALP